MSMKMQSLRSEAHRIFRNYALSPTDYSEAVGQFVRWNLNGEPSSEKALSTGDLVQKILYSIDCENVLCRRASA